MNDPEQGEHSAVFGVKLQYVAPQTECLERKGLDVILNHVNVVVGTAVKVVVELHYILNGTRRICGENPQTVNPPACWHGDMAGHALLSPHIFLDQGLILSGIQSIYLFLSGLFILVRQANPGIHF